MLSSRRASDGLCHRLAPRGYRKGLSRSSSNRELLTLGETSFEGQRYNKYLNLRPSRPFSTMSQVGLECYLNPFVADLQEVDACGELCDGERSTARCGGDECAGECVETDGLAC